MLGAATAVAVLGVAWAWTHAGGGDARLYRGGLALCAVAVTVLLAHVVLVPRGWPARLLSLAPLVLVGRISYGLYLWHWPTFIALNADRTGRQGVDLFVLRCLVTLGVATLSYLLVERPVREGRLVRFPRPAVTGVVVPTAIGTVAVLVLVITAVQGSRLAQSDLAGPEVRGAANGIDAVRSPTPTPDRSGPARAGPESHHPRAGRVPVVDVFGDSVAWTLVRYLPSHPGLDIRDRTILACGVARTGPYRYFGGTYPAVGPDCRHWPTLWRRAIAVDDPDVALVLVGRWETMDRVLEGRWTHVGEPTFDAYLRSELELAIDTVGAHGARVVLATGPYNRRGEQLDGSLYAEDHPDRVTAWNTLLRDVAADHPGVRVLELGARISPEGHFTWTAGGIQVRSDGLHLTPSGVQDWIAPWLLPKLRDAVGR